MMEPGVVSRIDEVTRQQLGQQQQLEQLNEGPEQADLGPGPVAASTPRLLPIIISLTGQPQPSAAGPGAAVLLPRNKNVLKERFILKNCSTADALSKLKVLNNLFVLPVRCHRYVLGTGTRLRYLLYC